MNCKFFAVQAFFNAYQHHYICPGVNKFYEHATSIFMARAAYNT